MTQNGEGGYRSLEVYKTAHALAVRVHEMSMGLPRHELYEEGSQVRRSSKRISASIVEGYALRKYRDLFLQYLYRSLGSCDETQEHLAFLMETGSLKDRNLHSELSEGYRGLAKKLTLFIKGVQRSHSTPALARSSSEIRNRKSEIEPEAPDA
jgi:four helix bundle protein